MLIVKPILIDPTKLPADCEVWTSGDVTLIRGDCLAVLPAVSGVDAVVADPPDGVGKGDWDKNIPNWLPLIGEIPTACFSGVIGMRDYPTPDWCGAWVRLASTQRNGKYRGFNNDTISEPNRHENTGHPTTKPTRLMERLVEKMPGCVVLDPFTGSGTTGVACVNLGRKFIGIEISPEYFAIAKARIIKAQQAKAEMLVA